ncbi:hypothetical protein GCM10009789_82870 [Kribbella sancticallisti]|uniref:Uncharacterized protein n=1 Tax=Kribbella sancticallisti TaxID=460087 RepID=A0ABN2ESE4_9ACTN
MAAVVRCNGLMSEPAEESAAAEHVLSDDPALDDAIWETLQSDIGSED